MHGWTGATKRPHEQTADSQRTQKRPRFPNNEGNCTSNATRYPTAPSRESYTIGWICPLPVELTAARAMLDEAHDDLYPQLDDHNTYTLGRIHKHYVAIACLPYGEYGTINAAVVAEKMQQSFRSIRLQLVVGIGGGVPNNKHDVRLGDIVVGKTVWQHDLGKVHNGGLERIGKVYSPPLEVRTALTKLESQHTSNNNVYGPITTILEERFGSSCNAACFANRSLLRDWLYESTYPHNGSAADDCESCDVSRRVNRPCRQNEDIPKIHYGTIASGNQVIKRASERDQLAHDAPVNDALCIEMEAAGLGDNIPHLVIRGICDYADSHKNKDWQSYAAAAAAAYARELLSVLPQRHAQTELGMLKFISNT